MLHFNVNGQDRLFFVDSGADYSTYDPDQWTLKKGQKQLARDVRAGDKTIRRVLPVASQVMPLYNSTVSRPAEWQHDHAYVAGGLDDRDS